MMRYPVANPVVSSPFDPNRRHPVLGFVRPHNGTDFGWKSGVELFVIADGVVAGRGVWNAAKRTPESGNWVSIDFILEGVRYRAVYLHMLSPSPLRVGQKVTEGMLAGVMGATGLVDGRHLHFEIRVMPADTPIDPELFLRGGSTAGVETPERPPVAPIEEDDMQADEREALMAIKAALLDGIPQTGMAKGRLDAIYDATETVRSRLFSSTGGNWDAFDELIRNTRELKKRPLADLPTASLDALGVAVADERARRKRELG